MLRCPSCEYEFPLRPRKVSWIRRLWNRADRECEGLPENVLTIGDLAVGDGAVVMCVGGSVSSRRNALAVFGMIPGAEATVLQQRPSCVIRLGETELALDPEIAGDILVRRAPSETLIETRRPRARRGMHERGSG